MSELTKRDRELIEAAEAAIRSRFRSGWHEIGAALRTADGRVFTAVNIDGYNSVCGEAAVIARAVADGEEDLDTIVAVRFDPEAEVAYLVPPCGRCRDLISEFGDVDVLYSGDDGPAKAPISEMLPVPFEPRGSRRRGDGEDGLEDTTRFSARGR